MGEDAAWQRGFPLDELRALAEPFKATDEGLVLGAFGAFRERDVAEARADDNLYVERHAGRPVAAVVCRRVRQQQGVKDFTGEERARMVPGDVYISRIGVVPGHEDAAIKLVAAAASSVRKGEALWVQRWVESKLLDAVLTQFPLRLAATKIPASSELVGVYGMARRDLNLVSVPEADRWGLRRLALRVPEELRGPAVGALSRLPGWADHYSSYNKGHAWSAVALRGYGDDPFFIEKPAEMSKGWKRENPELLNAEVRDTVARRALPELESLINLVPGPHQRVRLMRLEPGGGELTRHADITDPEAGTRPGRVLRIHLPLVTNPDVEFSSWTLLGERYVKNFRAGEAWYLDTRKPHTAVNRGASERIHLVVDAFSSPELLRLLEAGGNA